METRPQNSMKNPYTLTRSQMEESIIRVIAPPQIRLFREWLASLSDALIVKEYIAVMRQELKEAA